MTIEDENGVDCGDDGDGGGDHQDDHNSILQSWVVRLFLGNFSTIFSYPFFILIDKLSTYLMEKYSHCFSFLTQSKLATSILTDFYTKTFSTSNETNWTVVKFNYQKGLDHSDVDEIIIIIVIIITIIIGNE